MEPVIEHVPKWFSAAWLRRMQRSGATANLANTDKYLTLVASWRLSWQALDRWLCYRVDHGVIEMETESACVHLICGSSAIVPAGTPFRVRCLSPGCRLARCRFSVATAGSGCELIASPRIIPAAIGEMIELADQPNIVLHRERVAAALVTALAPLLEEGTQDRRRLNKQQRRTLETWCAEHVHERIEATDIAQLLGLSLDYCTRRFRATYGEPPRSWIIRQRLRHIAVALRESEASLDAIASAFGYQDANLMGRQFCNVYGISPGRYRRGSGHSLRSV